jgi:hypothetical protein
MSERLPRKLGEVQQVLKVDLSTDGGGYQAVHARFDLSHDNPNAGDLIYTPENGPRTRYLIVPADPLTDQIQGELQEANIPTLEHMVHDAGVSVYRVPLQAKPLIRERLFPDRASTDTYISDKELFRSLGGLWRRIYDASERLPVDRILATTGMIEFTKSQERLFPVPPFNSWISLPSTEHAHDLFCKQVKAGLEEAYPDINIESLLGEATSAFMEYEGE